MKTQFPTIHTFAWGMLLCLQTLVSAQDAQEPNDTKQAAKDLGTLTNAVTVERSNLTFHTDTDTDWFTFKLPAKRTVEIFITPAPGMMQSLEAAFEDKDNNPLTSDSGNTRFRLSYGGLPAGDYYFRVEPSNPAQRVGQYQVSVIAYDPDTFPGWLADLGLDPTLEKSADPGGDGVPLGVEWALRYPNPDAAKTPSWPYPILIDGRVGAEFLARQWLPFEGLRQAVLVEYSTDLETWNAVPLENISGGENPIPAGGSGNRDISFPYTMDSKVYLRTTLMNP